MKTVFSSTRRSFAALRTGSSSARPVARARQIGEEFADVMMYGLQLMYSLDIDVAREIERKIGIVLKRPNGVRGRNIPKETTEHEP